VSLGDAPLIVRKLQLFIERCYQPRCAKWTVEVLLLIVEKEEYLTKQSVLNYAEAYTINASAI
jgi:hypothetical protein